MFSSAFAHCFKESGLQYSIKIPYNRFSIMSKRKMNEKSSSFTNDYTNSFWSDTLAKRFSRRIPKIFANGQASLSLYRAGQPTMPLVRTDEKNDVERSHDRQLYRYPFHPRQSGQRRGRFPKRALPTLCSHHLRDPKTKGDQNYRRLLGPKRFSKRLKGYRALAQINLSQFDTIALYTFLK